MILQWKLKVNRRLPPTLSHMDLPLPSNPCDGASDGCSCNINRIPGSHKTVTAEGVCTCCLQKQHLSLVSQRECLFGPTDYACSCILLSIVALTICHLPHYCYHNYMAVSLPFLSSSRSLPNLISLSLSLFLSLTHTHTHTYRLPSHCPLSGMRLSLSPT